jgi:phospholipid/cholesterol/gamma-HCH transport system permease protein
VARFGQGDVTSLGERVTGERRVPRPVLIMTGRILSRGRLALGALYWLAWLSVSRRIPVRTGIQRELETLGIGALPLVVPASLLVGLIAIFQIASQLLEFGAEAMSIRAIAWFSAREFGPVGAALLVVARSASGIAGELASMRAGGEIDALRAMGLDPVKYLVAPKLAALLIGLPALTIISNALIIFGGWIGSTLFLDYSTNFFVEEFRSAFAIRDLIVGLGKSIIFAFIIGLVASDEGINVEGRVAAIGEATTRAVVYSVLAVLGADTFVNVVFYFIPGLA